MFEPCVHVVSHPTDSNCAPTQSQPPPPIFQSVCGCGIFQAYPTPQTTAKDPKRKCQGIPVQTHKKQLWSSTKKKKVALIQPTV